MLFLDVCFLLRAQKTSMYFILLLWLARAKILLKRGDGGGDKVQCSLHMERNDGLQRVCQWRGRVENVPSESHDGR